MAHAHHSIWFWLLALLIVVAALVFAPRLLAGQMPVAGHFQAAVSAAPPA
jgi:hypothetical protein